jgi:hypothetical protein
MSGSQSQNDHLLYFQSMKFYGTIRPVETILSGGEEIKGK